MKTTIENVMLVEKWNRKVEVFPKYLMGEVLPYLETLHSTSKFVFTFVQRKPFGMTQQITRVDTEFRRLLDYYGEHYNSSSYNMVSNTICI
jgi:hypothetical protein